MKTSFLQNGGEHNAFEYVSHSNHSRCLNLIKGPDPSYHVLKFGDNFPSSNQDMVQNVIL